MELPSQDFAHFLIPNLLAKAWSSRLPCHRLADWYQLRSFNFSKIPHLHLEWISCLMILLIHLIPRFATFHRQYWKICLAWMWIVCSVIFLLNKMRPVCICHLLVKIHENFLSGDHQSFRGRIVTFWHFQVQSRWWYWPVLLLHIVLNFLWFLDSWVKILGTH